MAEKPDSRGEIFVVDDDPAVRDTLSMVLSAGGYEVICFADGAALLAVARTRTPSCILLDVHIPGKSGLDILKELHGEDYPAPIFMISGQGDITMAVSAIKNGALDFIEKPFRGSEIVTRLNARSLYQAWREVVITIRTRSAAFRAPSFFMMLAR